MSTAAQGDSKLGLGGRRSKQSFAQRLQSTRQLVGYTADDEERVRATRDMLLPQADAIAGAVYEYLLSHPETAVHFTQPDGRPDRAHLMARAESLTGWLRMAIEAPLDEQLSASLAGIGRAHTKRGGSAEARVRGRYLLVTMSFVQTALIGLLDPAIADRGELLRTIAAWNKLLMIHLDLFLAVYGSAEANPHWY
ncbi:MAG: protoglobin family protein [Chloroflexota bacterium]|nr:protoglobin family protein [Chloroflexota bacterium]